MPDNQPDELPTEADVFDLIITATWDSEEPTNVPRDGVLAAKRFGATIGLSHHEGRPVVIAIFGDDSCVYLSPDGNALYRTEAAVAAAPG